MRVRLLGPTEIEGDGALGPRDRVVLTAFLVRPGDPLSPEQLADALWGESPPASWTKVIQGCVSRLRRALGADAIATVSGGYRLRPGVLDVDREEFESLVARGREYAVAGTPERAVVAFEQALGLWHGRPFIDLEEWEPGRLESVRLGEMRLATEEDLMRARLDAGDHPGVAAVAAVAVREEPWRERRWEILALAQYRNGRQEAALASIRTARRMLGSELGLDPGSALVVLEQSILAQDPSLAGDRDLLDPSAECPWKGLSPYALSDQDEFFGRSAEIAAALARLERHPLLVLTGPSGSGKSSLMLAGLAPALVRRGRQVVSFTPGDEPAGVMANALAGAPADTVVLVDQFEETFTLAAPGSDPAVWLDDLAAYAEQHAPVVITLRADQMVHLTVSSAFARMAESGVLLVSPLRGDELREAIEEPARRARLRLEHGLVDLMIRDTEGQPGALPLLSHALVETWRRREHGLLTVEGYHAAGELRGAVAASADRLYVSLTPVERTLLRKLMLRMVSLGGGGEPVRSVLPASSVAADPDRCRILERLARARLVTTDEESYELAHEELARAWPRLRSWLDEDVEEQQLVRHLAASAAGWDGLGRPDSELYRGARLEGASEWLANNDADPTPLERDFLAVSQARADDARMAKERQIRRERQQNRRLRALLVGVAALLVVATGVGGLAVERGRAADRDRRLAESATGVAEHESLVGRSAATRPTNRSAAALLAVEAYRARPGSPLSESALLATFTGTPGFLGHRPTPFPIVQGDTIPGGHEAVIASGTSMQVVDLATGRLGAEFDHPAAPNHNFSVVRVSGDGRRVAHLVFDPAHLDKCASYADMFPNDGRGCTLLTVFDVKTGRALFGPVTTPMSGGDVDIDRTGGLVAVTGGLDGDLVTYDVETDAELGRLQGIPKPPGIVTAHHRGAVVFGNRGRVYLGSLDGNVRVVDARTLKVVRTFEAPARSTHDHLALTSGGLLLGAGERALVALDSVTGEVRWTADLTTDADSDTCHSLAVAEEIGRFYCGSLYGELEERDLATGVPTGVQLDALLGEVNDISVSETNELVVFSRGYARWRLDGSGPVTRLVSPDPAVLGYDDTGRYLATIDDASHRVTVRDVADGSALIELGAGERPVWLEGELFVPTSQITADLLDPHTGERRDPADEDIVGLSERLFPTGRGDGRAWAVLGGSGPFGYDVVEVDVHTGALLGDLAHLPVHPNDVAPGPEPGTIWVTYQNRELGDHLSWDTQNEFWLALVDSKSGEVLRQADDVVVSAVSPDGVVVGSNMAGDISEFDPVSLDRVARLAGSRGASETMDFSADGRRLVVTGDDGTVQIYDAQTWTRLATFASRAPKGFTQGYLRPDGKAVAVNGEHGVVEWSLDPAVLAEAACDLAGRNMTRTEWATYMPDQSYRRTCPDYPAES